MISVVSMTVIALVTSSVSQAQDQAAAQAEIQGAVQCYSVNAGLAPLVLNEAYQQAGFDRMLGAEYEAAANFWQGWLGQISGATADQVVQGTQANVQSVAQSINMIAQAPATQRAAMRVPFETALNACSTRRAEIEQWAETSMVCFGREGLDDYQTGFGGGLAESSARVWLYVKGGQVERSTAEVRIAIGDAFITGDHGVSVMRYNANSDQVLGIESSYPAHIDIRWEGRDQRPFDSAPMRTNLIMPQPENESDEFYFGDMVLSGGGVSLESAAEVSWAMISYDQNDRNRPFAVLEDDMAQQAFDLVKSAPSLNMSWRDNGRTLLQANLDEFDFGRYQALLEAAQRKALDPANCSPENE